jgi:hypothetical protein
MKLVVVESPYAGDVDRNLRYLRAALADCLARGEAPYASHALYTQAGVLDDTVPEERAKGILAGFHWGEAAKVRAFYTDLGWSTGMRLGHDEAIRLGQAIEYRTLAAWARRPSVVEDIERALAGDAP